MPFEFKLPDIGEGVVEGEIVKWLVKPGDLIQDDQPMVEVMTDKATVTIPSPRTGKVVQTIGREGEIIKVGATMVVIEEGPSSQAEKAEQKPSTQKPAPPATMKTSESPSAREAPRQRSKVIDMPATEKVLATPATRKLARELGVDLSRVVGTGPQGRVTKDDLQRFSSAEGSAPTQVTSSPAPRLTEERVPFRGLRRKIAEKMAKSKKMAAHFTYVEEVDMTELVDLRRQATPLAEEQGVKLTYLPFIIKALIEGLKKYPMLNATLQDEKEEIVLKKYYHIGIGATTANGLTVVVIQNADEKSIFQLAREIETLAKRAREGTLSVEDLQGSTFTITSLGALGGMFATPIINYPEVAILGIHRIEPRPVVRNGQISVRDMMYMSLSFDHRVIDGAMGAEFAHHVIRYLESPNLLFIRMLK